MDDLDFPKPVQPVVPAVTPYPATMFCTNKKCNKRVEGKPIIRTANGEKKLYFCSPNCNKVHLSMKVKQK